MRGSTTRSCRRRRRVVELHPHTHPAAKPRGVDVGDRGDDAERREIGNARQHVAAAHRRALLRDDHVRRRRGRRAASPARAAGATPRARAAAMASVDRRRRELRSRVRRARHDRLLQLADLDVALLRRGRGRERVLLATPAPPRASLAFCCACSGRSRASSFFCSSCASQRGEGLVEPQAELRALALLLRERSSRRAARAAAATVSSVSSSSPACTRSPARRPTRSTRASTGLETTCSTSGMTVPAACSVASTAPRSTRAIARRRARPRDAATHRAAKKNDRGHGDEHDRDAPACRLPRTSGAISRSIGARLSRTAYQRFAVFSAVYAKACAVTDGVSENEQSSSRQGRRGTA